MTKKNIDSKTKKVRWIVSGIIFALIIGILATTMFFVPSIEVSFKLRPDLSLIDETALEVHFVDVGQGDAILVRFPNEETMLIDAGPSKSIDYLKTYIDNIFFQSSEEKSFDYALLTHGDADHSGGMTEILSTYSVGLFYRPATTILQQTSTTYETLLTKLDSLQAENKISVVTSTAGIVIKDGEINIAEFLSPSETYYEESNDYSPIILLTYCGEKIILTGDAGEDIEDEVLDSFTASDRLAELDVDVLKVSHHGSATASSLAFLETIKAEYSVISVAKQNSYNHPSDVTISNLMATGTDSIYKTSTEGNIICYVNQNKEVQFLFVVDAEDYLYVDWYIVVIIIIAVTIIFLFVLNIDKNKWRGVNKKLNKISRYKINNVDK